MGWPQIILIAIICIGLGISAERHGEMTETNFFISLISSCILMFLLWWGGFFG